MPKVSLNLAVNQALPSVQKWIGVVRETLGCPADAPDDEFFSEHSAGAVSQAYGDMPRKFIHPQDFLPTACGFYQHSVIEELLEIQAEGLRGGKPKYLECGPYLDRMRNHWYMLPDDVQVRYTAELLASSVPLNKLW